MTDSIFQPKYDITPQMKLNIADIERQCWLVGARLLPPKHEAWFRRDVSIKRAAGTTRIEGATMDEEQVSELAKKRTEDAKLNDDERANLNALQAYAFVDYLSDQGEIALDELVIRELNRYFLAGGDQTLTPGVYRKGQNEVFNYTPADQGDVPPLMREFALWLESDDETPAVLKAGMAHIHLVAIHPFWDGNGRTARALATTILQRAFPGFQKLLSLESFIFSVRDHYFAALEATFGGKFSSDYDATRWLEFFTTSMVVHVRGLAEQMIDWQRVAEPIYAGFEPAINHRQVDALLYAAKTGRITRSEYTEITGVSNVTASRDLARLTSKGWLAPMGKTRSRVYFYTKAPPPAQAELNFQEAEA